ncbi:MAG TPA: AAA family ATPase [Acetobacteraceae bacterium]|nr:AAA family ATPase [Acetobacteraceae bacterium]
MKLRTLELEQFRKFARPVRVAGIRDGLNVLCGPNEFGKSTLLAAIRGLLFERYGSKADPIKRMQCWGGNAAPRLAMEFEVGDGVWRIEKRFVHQPYARLTAPSGARFDNDAAEERLQELLGFGAAGKQGAKLEQMGVWGALWVTQRDSVLQPDLAGARGTISGCLDAEVGVLTGTEKGQALLKQVRERLFEMVDGNGKPKGRHRTLNEEIAARDKTLGTLRDRAARLAEDAEALREQTRRRDREGDPAAAEADAAALADARRRLEAVLLHQRELERAQTAHELTERKWQDALAEHSARCERIRRIVESRASADAEMRAAETARATVAAVDAEIERARAGVAAAQARHEAAGCNAHRLRRIEQVARERQALALLEAALAEAETVEERRRALQARFDAARVTPERIEAIRAAVRERDTARSALDAQATVVAFELLPGHEGSVSIAGEVLAPGRRTIAISDEAEIAIAGIGRIVVSPAIQNHVKLAKRISAAELHLRESLMATACADHDAAERGAAERSAAERDLNDARAQLARLVPGNPQIGLMAGIEALREKVDASRRVSAIAFVETGPEAEDAPEDILARVRAADAEEDAAKHALSSSAAVLSGAQERRSALHETQVRADERVDAERRALRRFESDAAEADAREPEVQLTERIAETDCARQASGATLAALERARPEDTPEGMRARVARYEQAVKDRDARVQRLNVTIAEIRARIAGEGGFGLDEEIARVERERDAFARERAGIAHEIAVLTLLRDTLEAAEREAKERYLEPVVRRITPHLQGLFPGAEIACDEAFRITGLTRAIAEEFDRLSDGTQEQIAVLARLAFAEMLVDRGKPAMVVLDDALAYADFDRMERMFDILAQASRKVQILILTCREDIFARLGGTRLEVKACDVVAA